MGVTWDINTTTASYNRKTHCFTVRKWSASIMWNLLWFFSQGNIEPDWKNSFFFFFYFSSRSSILQSGSCTVHPNPSQTEPLWLLQLFTIFPINLERLIPSAEPHHLYFIKSLLSSSIKHYPLSATLQEMPRIREDSLLLTEDMPFKIPLYAVHDNYGSCFRERKWL